ncbi:thioredoxin family protein [Metabacillus litoralis]|uniref:Thioredoxin family protein n=1 Tax=Metabacillus litoralis TaxID=152268 RepID=A0A5C6W465_9BACI|nr:thioredoxin family protein [Metabacillus litoralis]TXC91172.1 thioredoxin family protein [Metabacillus litoralis]
MIEWNEKQLTISENGIVILYLYTPMCGTCQIARKMLTVVNELVQSDIFAVNLNYFPNEAIEMGIESVPCLLVYKDGILKEKVYAFQSVGYLHDLLKQYQS